MGKFIKLQEVWLDKNNEPRTGSVIINSDCIISIVPGGWKYTASPTVFKYLVADGDLKEMYTKEVERYEATRIHLVGGERVYVTETMQEMYDILKD
jgi:hypothetical protein